MGYRIDFFYQAEWSNYIKSDYGFTCKVVMKREDEGCSMLYPWSVHIQLSATGGTGSQLSSTTTLTGDGKEQETTKRSK